MCPISKVMEVKERILKIANELYMRYGVRSITMDEIAVQAGISKKTIYQFFADKDELVEAVFKAEIQQSESQCDRDRAASTNALEEVFKALDMIEEMFRNMNPTLVYDTQKFHPKAYQHLEKHKSEYLLSMIKDNIVRGQQEGLYREDINVDIMAHFRIESMMLPFNPAFSAKSRHNLADVEHEIMIHFLYGLASPKGYKLITKYQQERNKKTINNEKTMAK